MSSRTKKIIGVIVAIIILLLLLLLLWLSSQRPEEVVIQNQPVKEPTPIGALNRPPSTLKPPIFEATEPAAPEPEPDAAADPRSNLRSLAAAFAERYGSYSNQGDYANLEELQALMTDSLAAKTQDYIAQARAAGPGSAAYIGYTSRAISTTISNFKEEAGRATVLVNTQRQETTAQGTRVYYQNIELQFLRDGEIWRVNTATWADESG